MQGARLNVRRTKYTEAEFTTQVINYARLMGWRVAHFRPGMDRKGRWKTAVQGDGAGFPDLILIRGSTILAIELKSEGGKLEEPQQAWLDAFHGAGVFSDVWRPAVWPVIEKILAQQA